jgi:cytochrome c553
MGRSRPTAAGALRLDASSNIGSGHTNPTMAPPSRASLISTQPPHASMMLRSVLRPSVYRHRALTAEYASTCELEQISMYFPSPRATHPSVSIYQMKMAHCWFRVQFLLLVLFVAVGTVTHAASPMHDGKGLYAPCIVCHQPNAWGSPDGRIPNLAGQGEGYLANQIAAFRSGARTGTAMHVVSAHSRFGDPSDVTALAEYLSALDMNPKPVVGPGENLRLGQEIYAYICATCHGFNGEGGRKGNVPRIAQQHYPYLRREIMDIARLHRKISNAGEDLVLGRLSAVGKDAVADYISRLSKSEAAPELKLKDAGSKLHDASP